MARPGGGSEQGVPFGAEGNMDPREAQKRSVEARKANQRRRNVFLTMLDRLDEDDELFKRIVESGLDAMEGADGRMWAQYLDRTLGPVKQIHDLEGHKVPNTQLNIGEAYDAPPVGYPWEEKQDGEVDKTTPD